MVVKYKGIVFDFNGVILWDSAWHDAAWKEMSIRLRGREITSEETRDIVRGRTNRQILTYLLGRTLSDSEFAELAGIKEQKYQEIALAQKDFKLSPGASELFDLLRENNIPFTIATSSENNNVDFYFKHLGLGKWFAKNDIIYDEGVLPGKPAPDIYLLAARKLNLSPKDCIAVEDAKSGILSADSAGIGKIIALGPKEKHELFYGLSGVKQIITNLDEVSLEDFEK